MTRIVCAGHVNWDVTLRVEQLPDPDGEAQITEQCQSGGGSAANTATVLAGLDHDPLLVGSLGGDRYAKLVEEELDRTGVDCRYLRRFDGQETTVKYLVVDEDGEVFVFANEGANEAFSADDLPRERLTETGHLHLTGQAPGTAAALLDRADELDVSVSFDPGRRLGQRQYEPIVEAVDLLFVNEREASAARNRNLFERREGRTVIKRGDGGATLLDGARTLDCDGFDVTATDTAGAGDAFAGGFLAAELDGKDDRQALRVANACGALAVQSVGARVPISWETVEEYLDR
ncbi:PfkB family carbohydrate kinase [Halobacteriaceae archaeon SHR40]|uniref:carbohydrate kinase family protein n=1 Tax=Halovenus amylolytica TaxID=2500550 RepID=UPI000FE3A601